MRNIKIENQDKTIKAAFSWPLFPTGMPWPQCEVHTVNVP